MPGENTLMLGPSLQKFATLMEKQKLGQAFIEPCRHHFNVWAALPPQQAAVTPDILGRAVAGLEPFVPCGFPITTGLDRQTQHNSQPISCPVKGQCASRASTMSYVANRVRGAAKIQDEETGLMRGRFAGTQNRAGRFLD